MGPSNIAAGTVLLIALAVPARAQETPPVGGAEIRFAAGIVWQGGIFGDDDPESGSGPGAILGLQLRRRTTGLVGASLEFALQPIGLPNPHFDETLRTFYVMAGPEIGRRFYVRPAAGIALQMWSGAMAESGLGAALAAGIAVGWRRDMRRRGFSPEFVVRCSAAPGAASTMVGVQVAISGRN